MPVTFQSRTLPNGLTLIAETDPHAHSAAIGFFVKTGARDEPSPLMGVSHFLEHMMFKGTADISAEELNRRFDAMGARNNAYTSNELTCFYAHVLPERLLEAADLLARMMRPALHQHDFDTEKGVILEEIAMYKDKPFWVLYEAATERHFGPHPLSHRVLGTTDSITALRRDQMQAYFDNRYSADNTVVALAGNLDFNAAADQIAAHCAAWAATRVSRDNARPAIAGGRFDLHSDKVNRAYVLAIGSGPPIDDDRRYAAALLAQIFGGPDNSRLHWSLVEPGIAEEAQASYEPHDGYGDFQVFLSGDPARADEIWALAERESARLRDSLAQHDIDHLLEKLVAGVIIGGERPHDRMHRLGAQWTYRAEYRTLEEELDAIRKVTLADLRDTLDAFPLRPATIGRLSPA